MKPFLLALFMALLLSGCGKQQSLVLVPWDKVRIYSDIQRTSILGVSEDPLQVIALRYPDKADYVVEVRFNGHTGFVVGGLYDLKKQLAPDTGG